MINRKLAPEFTLDYQFKYSKAEIVDLKNNQRLYYVPSLNQQMIKLELVFNAGFVNHQNSIIPTTVAQLLFDGTIRRNSNEIANLIEGEGAFYDATCSAETFSITVYVLKNNLEKVLEVVTDVIKNASFPEIEIDKFVKIQKQKFLVNKEKVSFLARNKFSEAIYPKGSSYHSALNEADFDLINRDELIGFHKSFIKANTFRVYSAGALDKKSISTIDNYIGALMVNENPAQSISFVKPVDDFKIQLIKKEQSLQSGIRIGKLLIPKTHKDFPKLFLLNTIFGGYFGSRLMTNIREDKGYTYGIGSGLSSNKKESTFFITTEVGSDYTQATIAEIEKEMEKLQKQLVSESELDLVKNYLFGSFMRNFDGAFEAIDRFKAINELGMDYSYYEFLFSEIKNASSESLREMAKKYFNFDKMVKVVAGKIN